MGIFLLTFIILFFLEILNNFLTERYFMKKAHYDCSKCKNWKCPKRYCDEHKKTLNSEVHIYDEE